MKKNKIFLSYRRDDSPGYVSRLEDELERVFGEGRVFRDASDIPGGTKWKNVIDANLHSSAVLLLIIGPRWEEIWQQRINDDVNYVALELQRARELDVPIIPVTLDGVQLSSALDLGSIQFIYENQFYDLSDKQGRWRGDFQRLVALLESLPGLDREKSLDIRKHSAQQAESGNKSGNKSGIKWIAVFTIPLVAVALWLGTQTGNKTPEKPISPNPSVAALPASEEAAKGNIRPVDNSTNTQISPEKNLAEQPVVYVPDIEGVWQGRDNTLYYIQQFEDGTFNVDSPGYTTGTGRFFTKMPGKFEVHMQGVGRGEFAVSTSGEKAMGWMLIDGQQQFDTLNRIE